MRAALMSRGSIWVDELPEPQPQRGELLVASRACGICGSDLHAHQHTEDFVRTSREAGGAFKLTTFDPVVLGHEFCAEILDYGPATDRRWPVGTLVCSVPVLLRDEMLPIGYSDQVPGGFAERMLLSESLVLPVPGGTPAPAAAMTEPMAVGVHAVNMARLQGGEAVLVLGCGPVGLAVIGALKARGVGPVVAADFSPARRRLAARQGADQVIDPAVDDPYARRPLQQDAGVVIFECVGVPGMLDQIFLKSPRNARIVVVGVCLQTDHARPLIAINKELNVQYVLGYSPEEFRDTLHGIAEGAISVEHLITAQVGLEEVEQAFLALRDPERHAKILVTPDPT